MKCPLKSYEYSGYIDCYGSGCAFADDVGDCLVGQALRLYVSQEKTKIAEKTSAMQHFEMLHKNGLRTPISFIEESE